MHFFYLEYHDCYHMTLLVPDHLLAKTFKTMRFDSTSLWV